ncbi:uncharacterized protein K02A2.6-like [Rhipicephalus sanguineus]|uniref:uncharacterized protein K02A2.6-like n=1 Tax=Rhipicephalus sanguineus TaxID=34632 RepID=UPI0020C263A9|nr:uncharacterized protein K02A2.6-like [Rhipicephalus sanguineus]
MPTALPDRPWQRLSVNLFYTKGSTYLLVADCYSRYFEIALLEDERPVTSIQKMKSIFAHHGIPDTVATDNWPQFHPCNTSEFSKFAREWGFKHVTSSPKYPQSNGFAKAAVKIAKQKIAKAADPYKALLAYRATPLENGYSPAELLFGRRVHTTVPISPHMLKPTLADSQRLQKTKQGIKQRQERNYNHRRGVRRLLVLNPGQQVWIKDLKRRGAVLRRADSPRSYWIQCETGTVRRNRRHLVKDSAGVALDNHSASLDMPSRLSAQAPGMKQPGTTQSTPTAPSPYVTAHGRTVRPPARFRN